MHICNLLCLFEQFIFLFRTQIVASRDLVVEGLASSRGGSGGRQRHIVEFGAHESDTDKTKTELVLTASFIRNSYNIYLLDLIITCKKVFYNARL